jgi:ADYC domain
VIARALRLLCGLGGSILALPSEAQDVLRVEGTEWIAHLPGDRQLRSADLVGAQLQVAGGIELRIDAATLHHDHRGQSWWSHELSMRAAGQAWQPLCAPHSDGSSFAIVLPGQETTDGMLADHPDAFALSCSRGALAKCLRLGYRPWERDGAGRPMRPVFNACIRMIRADYGGTGEPHTLEGQTIDVYDDVGVQSPDGPTARCCSTDPGDQIRRPGPRTGGASNSARLECRAVGQHE